MAFQHCQSHSCVPVVCTGLKKIKAAEPFYNVQGDSMYESTWKSTIRHFLLPLEVPVWHIYFKKDFFKWTHVFNFIGWRNLFFQHYLRVLSAKNANHLQTTDTLKRHQRYSIHYHCGWPSLGIWGSATHNGLPALPEPFLRACGLHKVCTGLKKNQNSRVILTSLWFAQGLHKAQKNKTAEPFSDVQGGSMYSIYRWCNIFFHVTKSNKGKSKCGGTLPGRGHKSARCRWNRLRRSSSGGDCNVYGSQDADNHQDSRERSSVVPEVTPTRSGAHATHPEVLRTLGWSVLWPKALREPNVTTSKRGKWTWTPQL